MTCARYVSTLLVQFFECQRVEAAFYLIADYSSRCFDATWKRMLVPEAILAIIYPIGTE